LLPRARGRTELARPPCECRSAARAPRRARLGGAFRPPPETTSCRSGNSPNIDERKLAFTHGFGGEAKRVANIVRFKIGIAFEDVFGRHAVGDHADDGGNRNARASNTGHAVHLFW